MIIVFYVLVFLVGMITGSFLNVCIYRIPREESIVFPPSHCTSCGKVLKPIELVPILSFIFLRGKCRYCGAKISIRYPLIEILTAVIFALLFNTFGFSPDLFASAFLMSILIAVFFIDIDHRIIPNGLVLTGLIGGIIIMFYNAFTNQAIFNESSWLAHLLGILPGSGILFFVALIGLIIYKSDEAMGMGDVKIFAPIGIFLGWKLCFLALLISIVFAGVFSLLLILTGVKKRKDTIPFGPFIVAGTFVTMMWGTEILNWYIHS